MWTAKFRIFDDKNEISMVLRNTQVRVHYYPINHYLKKDRYYFIAVGLVEGDEKKKESFFKDLLKLKSNKKGRKLEMLEKEGDFFVAITSHNANNEARLFVKLAYNPSLIHIEPILWTEDGCENWKIASIERKDIEDLIGVAETKYQLELFSFARKKIRNFGFMTILPTLSEKQKMAIGSAVNGGYYKYPRKKNVQDLAKEAKLSFSTFQEHLRRAENKIIPFVTEQIG